MTTIILRHRRENLKKCSLRGLENHPDLKFYTYPTDILPNYSGLLLLKVGAPPLTLEDRERDLLLIDGTWRLAQTIEAQLPWPIETRSLPGSYKTAYPRKQTACSHPESGLSSVEALYLAHRFLGRSTEKFLDQYYWRESFLRCNAL